MTEPIHLDAEKAALLSICEQDRQAHLDTDVAAALASYDDPYIYVRDGKIQRLARADTEPQYRKYFGGATFHEWDDIEPPIMQISNDGSMAWVIRRVRVRYTRPDDAGQEAAHAFVYAGISTYEKRAGQWVCVANVSTFGSAEEE